MTNVDSKRFVESLKDTASIVDVISKKVRLSRSGRDWFGLCPFHQEKTPSFKVNPESQSYYCFGCGMHGDVITFVMESERASFSEALEILANMYNVQMPQKVKNIDDSRTSKIYSALDTIKKIFISNLQSNIGYTALEYLKLRNMSQESIDKFQLGFSGNGKTMLSELRRKEISDDILLETGVFFQGKYKNSLINKFEGRLIFPIFDASGKCVGFGGRVINKADSPKYINSPESEVFVKSKHLYGYSLAKKGQTRQIILVEGYLDVIAMHQAGFDGAVAPLGTSISETQINMCWRVTDNPVIALDGDEAGFKASYRWIDKILPALLPGKSFSSAKFPHGFDPDLLISKGQRHVISEAISTALSLSDWLWEGAFLLYPSSTPEQKAAIIKTISEKIDLIQDVSIKKLYKYHIKQKESEIYRRRWQPPRNFIDIKPIMNAKEKIEKIFLVTVVNHPYIIDRLIETLVSLDFTHEPRKKVKEKILDAYNDYFTIGEKEKYAMEIEKLRSDISDFAKNITQYASFASEKSSDDDAAHGCLDTCERFLSDSAIAEDLQYASNSLKSSFSDDDWRRLKALKKEVLLKKNT